MSNLVARFILNSIVYRVGSRRYTDDIRMLLLPLRALAYVGICATRVVDYRKFSVGCLSVIHSKIGSELLMKHRPDSRGCCKDPSS